MLRKTLKTYRGVGGFRLQHVRNMFIRVQETPNPLSLRFLPGQKILSDSSRTYDFVNMQQARKSPLARQLLGIDGVKGVFFGEDFVTITKEDEDEDWAVIKPNVFATLMDYLQSGRSVLSEDEIASGPTDTTILPEDSEITAMIKELLEDRIKPMVQQDGGDVLYVGYEDGIVKLKLQGSCTGCPSSSVTLKNGIKNMLKFYVPEIEDIVEVVDEEEKLSDKEFKNLEISMKKPLNQHKDE